MSALYLYSDFTTACWAATPDDWRHKTGKTGNPVRCAHPDVAPPAGYHKPNGHLAYQKSDELSLLEWELSENPNLVTP